MSSNGGGLHGHRRKTSAEIISEAKNVLAGGAVGTRLVSTHRPITPRDPRRQLYPKQAPPGRPPSAINLRYLQFESRALPSLEPIQQNRRSIDNPSRFTRSGSLDRFQKSAVDGGQTTVDATNRPYEKLPALLQPPKLGASLDNLLAQMPPRKSAGKRIVKEKLMRNHKSIDDNLPSVEKIKDRHKTRNPVNDLSRKDTTKARLTRHNELLAQSSTEGLLDMLKDYSGLKDCTEDTANHIIAILSELYTRVKGAKGGWRGAILSALYGLVECNSSKVLLAVARIVLVLCVTGSNLTGACKLVYKVARNEVNDMLFVDSDVPELLIDGLGRASPLDDPEACIYGYGAVRFLASAGISGSNDGSAKTVTKQKSLAQRLARHGAVQLIVLHLQLLNEAGAATKLQGPSLHALFQLSAALRSLAEASACILSARAPKSAINTPFSGKSLQPNFPVIKESLEVQEFRLDIAVPHLVRAAEICMGEIEVQTNIIRTLSILSDDELACSNLAPISTRLGVILGTCMDPDSLLEKKMGLVSRLGYILGNVMAQNNDARLQFFNNDVAMGCLLDSLELFSRQKLTLSNQSGDTVIDVLVKLVRVVANISVNNEVGSALGIRHPLGSVLFNLLQKASISNSAGNWNESMEELLLATLGALHNLSFFHELTPNHQQNPLGSLTDRMSDISSILCKTLDNDLSLETRAEAARVLGNLTRNLEARDAFCGAGGIQILIRSLDSDNYDLVATSCGVLVNLLSDWERRAPFREINGPSILRITLMKGLSQRNWFLAEIVCQAYWNFLIDASNATSALGKEESNYISSHLAEYLDEESLFNEQTPDPLWEQFASVATDLLERIQSSAPYEVLLSEEDDNYKLDT